MIAAHTKKYNLLAITLLLLAVWGYILPAVSQHPRVQRRIDLFQRHGINTTAIFYTDLHTWPGPGYRRSATGPANSDVDAGTHRYPDR